MYDLWTVFIFQNEYFLLFVLFRFRTVWCSINYIIISIVCSGNFVKASLMERVDRPIFLSALSKLSFISPNKTRKLLHYFPRHPNRILISDEILIDGRLYDFRKNTINKAILSLIEAWNLEVVDWLNISFVWTYNVRDCLGRDLM